MRVRAVAILVVALVASLPKTAPGAEDTVGAWTIFSTTGAFSVAEESGRWRYWFDGQARYPDIGSGSNQYVLRPGIGYEVGSQSSVWFGYARFRSRSASGSVTDENRYWQQFSWAGKSGSAGIILRARLEQRFVEAGDDTGLILRTMARYTWPLGGTKARAFVLSVEPFFSLRDTDWSGDAGMAQNRVYAAVDWRVSDTLSVQTGYMHQYVSRATGEDRSNHLAMINFRKRFRRGK